MSSLNAVSSLPRQVEYSPIDTDARLHIDDDQDGNNCCSTAMKVMVVAAAVMISLVSFLFLETAFAFIVTAAVGAVTLMWLFNSGCFAPQSQNINHIHIPLHQRMFHWFRTPVQYMDQPHVPVAERDDDCCGLGRGQHNHGQGGRGQTNVVPGGGHMGPGGPVVHGNVQVGSRTHRGHGRGRVDPQPGDTTHAPVGDAGRRR